MLHHPILLLLFESQGGSVYDVVCYLYDKGQIALFPQM